MSEPPITNSTRTAAAAAAAAAAVAGQRGEGEGEGMGGVEGRGEPVDRTVSSAAVKIRMVSS